MTAVQILSSFKVTRVQFLRILCGGLLPAGGEMRKGHSDKSDRARAEYISDMMKELLKLAEPLNDPVLSGLFILAWRLAAWHVDKKEAA